MNGSVLATAVVVKTTTAADNMIAVRVDCCSCMADEIEWFGVIFLSSSQML